MRRNKNNEAVDFWVLELWSVKYASDVAFQKQNGSNSRSSQNMYGRLSLFAAQIKIQGVQRNAALQHLLHYIFLLKK